MPAMSARGVFISRTAMAQTSWVVLAERTDADT